MFINPEKVSIVINIDNNYIQPTTVMLASLFVNNEHLGFDIYIIHNGLLPHNADLLKAQISRYGHQVTFIWADDQPFKNVRIPAHITMATFLRLILSSLLPTTLEKILYLDTDMIIRQTIDDLWHSDLSGYSHAAVEDTYISTYISTETKEKLGMQIESRYFNAGLLLINLSFWRKYDVWGRSFAFIMSSLDKIAFGDQDILNYVLENQSYFLPYDWNAQREFFSETNNAQSLKIPFNDYQRIKTQPKIVHFTGPDKPWLSTTLITASMLLGLLRCVVTQQPYPVWSNAGTLQRGLQAP